MLIQKTHGEMLSIIKNFRKNSVPMYCSGGKHRVDSVWFQHNFSKIAKTAVSGVLVILDLGKPILM